MEEHFDFSGAAGVVRVIVQGDVVPLTAVGALIQ